MFKSRRHHSLSYGKRQRRRGLPFLGWIILFLLSIPLSLVVLEFLARVLLDSLSKNQEFVLEPTAPPLVTAYRLKFLDEQRKPYNLLPSSGQLAVQRKLSVGYQLVGEQKSDFWQINSQGFREAEAVPLVKPQGEIRIFILGGSAAFGLGNESNEATITSKLEARLNQRVQQQQQSPEKYRPDVFPFFKPSRRKAFALPAKIREGNYRVINAAVPGYTSGNELAQLALKILPYQPDLVVVLDGYTDLMLPSNQKETEIPTIGTYINDPQEHFKVHLSQSLQEWMEQFYLVQAVQNWLSEPEPVRTEPNLVINQGNKAIKAYLPPNELELEKRVNRYRQHHLQMARLSAGAGIPLVVVVQPEITGRAPTQLNEAEKSILMQLGPAYRQKIPQYYPQLVAAAEQLPKDFPNNARVLNLYNLPPQYPVPSFTDPIHLTEAANKAIAQQIYYAIASLEKMQIIPQNYYLNRKK